MIYNEIAQAFNDTIELTVKVDQRDNEHYTPTLLTPWIRTTFLPAETNNLTRGDNPIVRLNGLYQIDIITPAGSGTTNSNTTSSQLVDYFYNNRTISLSSYDDIRIVSVWGDVPIQNSDWFITPLSIRWEHYYTT